ncbi:ABC transporter permease [Streptomyces nitrosporeus]|uniref:ABC transporter permease n=1 Tax=Streptomyces nitrosporeus TaxID=28894 RepID=A0A5J6F6U8_9ACTN|nr:ABC transporter permease subunit [Streptomyces nitrosporeus]QEU71776.1 ABC transporter permease [Streptomyces nitrosporeus]GGY94350.1 ABC transporter [Streptomyces nitrosporeus]
MSFVAVLHSEWTKIRSVRSAAWALPLSAALLIGIGAGVCGSVGAAESDAEDFDPVQLGYYGLFFAHVVVIAFAVLVVGNEYSTGTIRTSLAAVPRRGLLYGAKLTTGAALALAAGATASAGTFLASQSLLGEHGLSPGDEGAVRAVVAGALYFPLLALMCMGVTAMLRSRTLSMGLLVPVLFLVSPVLAEIPGLRALSWYLPDRAGQYALRSVPDPAAPYTPAAGLLVLALWASAATAGGWLVLRRRDA